MSNNLRKFTAVVSPHSRAALSRMAARSLSPAWEKSSMESFRPRRFHLPATWPRSSTAGRTIPARLKMPRRYPGLKKRLSFFS